MLRYSWKLLSALGFLAIVISFSTGAALPIVRTNGSAEVICGGALAHGYPVWNQGGLRFYQAWDYCAEQASLTFGPYLVATAFSAALLLIGLGLSTTEALLAPALDISKCLFAKDVILALGIEERFPITGPCCGTDRSGVDEFMELIEEAARVKHARAKLEALVSQGAENTLNEVLSVASREVHSQELTQTPAS
ncbi:hypothetical protein [Sinomonas gamaensis]|uniref:hypothetical protein n=1 Tax=Sinomonas gamaensis TaxID=2565624 RepID=UPI001108F7B3|nr:hypothetical protein [Sinomonas gamaensis]